MRAKRSAISRLEPIAQQMWAKGRSLREISLQLGLPIENSTNYEAYFGAIDPTPQPLGCPPFAALSGESAEERAFRRFPIAAHKPGSATATAADGKEVPSKI